MSMQRYKSHQDGFIWRCNGCTKKTSVRVGTALMHSKLSLKEILNLIYKFSTESLVINTSAELNIDKNAVSRWNSLFRQALEKHLEAKFEKLGGEGITVQIDETVIAKRKYNRGRIVPQQWLFGAIDTISNHCILKCIDDRSKATLKRVIMETLTEGSIVHSDMWSSYMSIFRNNENFTHDTVNHSENFVNPETGVHTNTIENLWMLLKQSLRRKLLRSRIHLDLYLAEFCARHQHKNNYEVIFLLVCEALKYLND